VKYSDLTYQIALTLLKGIGPIKARHLLSKLGSIESIFHDSLKSISIKAEINLSTLKQMNREEALLKAEKHYVYYEKNDVKTHFYLDDTYPRRLKQCADSPLLLFDNGNVDLNYDKIVAIVGTRHATDYGKSVCDEIVQGFIGKKILVVSGMAYGIDICVHQLCVKYGIPTIGVLGHGLDRLYPSEHKHTALKMLENGGLLTEYLPGTNPDRENFPMRNRIVAGMSDATIVVESKESGGSLITADFANDYSRDVFAIPGNVGQIYSKGCNLLISKQKAHLITGSKDFLNWMQWNEEKKAKPVQRALFTDFSEEENIFLSILEREGELNVDSLALKANKPVSKVNVMLFNLEMVGAVKMLPGNKYRII
jgi:DNA processing protein